MSEIYLDHNATTPIHPRVRECLIQVIGEFGNPSSLHGPGRRAAEFCEDAREAVSTLLGCSDPARICFTGCGSEANVLALFGAARVLRRRRQARLRILGSSIEHPSVLEALRRLRQEGDEVCFLPVDGRGFVRLDLLEEELARGADLVTIMWANNEVGTVQPLPQIAAMSRRAGALFHTDAVQAAGKLPIDVEAVGIDLLSVSAHKLEGPKGVGALYVRRGVGIDPLVVGGGQENGLRSGTENVLGISGFGEAANLASETLAAASARVRELRDRLWMGLQRKVPDIYFLGCGQSGLPGTLAIRIAGIRSEALMLRLDMEGIAVSTGSACHSGATGSSHVLTAMGLGPAHARETLRISLGPSNTAEEIGRVLDILPLVVSELRTVAGHG